MAICPIMLFPELVDMTEHSINDANMTDANFTGAITTGFTGGGNIRK